MENRDYLGSVPLLHAVLGPLFHLQDQLANRLGVSEFPSRSEEGFQPRFLLQKVTAVGESTDQLNDGSFPVPRRETVVLFINHALGCLQLCGIGCIVD